MKKFFFGIMQGRLLPKYRGNFQAHPVGYWQEEFKIASNLGFDCIEFILDYHKANLNPLLLNRGLEEISLVSKKNKVLIRSICADYFMESPIFSSDLIQKKENFFILKKLILNAEKIGVTDIIVPFVDNSSVLIDKKRRRLVVEFFKDFFQEINLKSVNICLETDLPPHHFLEFIDKIDHPRIKINYDTGNSASLGYDFYEEFNTYGHLITNIHIKDRKFNGGSIELGKGDCNFENLFMFLSEKKYNGIFVLQAFRGEDGIASLMPQLNYLKKQFKKYYNFL